MSIVLPARNERAFLRDCLDSLVGQDHPNIVEILVVDGGSTDGTQALAEAVGHPVRVIDNPGITAASAMNLGIEQATADIIVRADAHTIYAPDFVRRSVEVLEQTGAAVVGGPMQAVGTTSFGRAVAAVTSSPFGIGPGRFHYATEPQEVETVYLGTYLARTVQDVGGYDTEELQWAAEDQELNFRIRQAGGQIWCDPAIRSTYFPRSSPRALWRQYYNYGLCKASTLKKHRTLPYWRPLAPAFMVAGAVLTGLAAVGLGRRHRLLAALAPEVLYLGGASVVALRLSREPGVAPHRCLGALAICHWGYGLGFWAGMARIATGRPFDVVPRAR